MTVNSAGVSQWTEYFVVSSACSLVAYFASVSAGLPHRIQVLLGLYGFACLMVFGMGYLLVPPYVGRTVIDHRFAGIHLAFAVSGLCLLVATHFVRTFDSVGRFGGLLWASGVAVFAMTLAATALSARSDQGTDRAAGVSGRNTSPGWAAAAIPVAVAYLLLGTVARFDGLPVVGSVPVPHAPAVPSHAYASGFAGLLVFALRVRLLPGFFGASPPRRLLSVVVGAGATAPLLLTVGLWVDPWFSLGAVLEGIAMVGYAVCVAVVLRRSERVRVGGYGIAMGAAVGVAATVAGASAAFGVNVAMAVNTHVRLVIGDFLPLTIVGYAVLFFPVTGGQFRGATHRTVRFVLVALFSGLVLQVTGLLCGAGVVARGGAATSLVGSLTYLYLVGRRLIPRGVPF